MSGSENMIERVARAICASDFDGDTSVYDTMSEAMRENFTINARAAIEALMEPTAAMYLACWPIYHPWGQNAPPPADRHPMYDEMKANLRKNWQAALRSSLM